MKRRNMLSLVIFTMAICFSTQIKTDAQSAETFISEECQAYCEEIEEPTASARSF